MSNVVFVEVFAVIQCLKPELTKSFALGIRSYDAVEGNETSKAYAVESFGVKDGSGVANAFS